MPVYNGEEFVDTSIQSILGQTFKDYEFLILNDGSKDKTLEIIYKYSQKDNRIKIINQSNAGLTKSLNTCINLSQGTYIARQDADDISVKSRLEKQVYFLRNEKYDFCCSRTYIQDRKIISPRLLYYLPFKFTLLFYNPFIHGSWMFKKSIIDKIGMYDESIKYAQDYDFVSRLIYAKKRVKYIKENLYITGTNLNKISEVKKDRQNFYSNKISIKNRIRIFK